MKANPKPWLYGPNWQGIRCEARTRRGTLCQRPARLPVGRCKLHGGASTGPRTKDGLARLTESKIKHGKFTKEKRAEARRFAEEGRQMRGELKELGGASGPPYPRAPRLGPRAFSTSLVNSFGDNFVWMYISIDALISS